MRLRPDVLRPGNPTASAGVTFDVVYPDCSTVVTCDGCKELEGRAGVFEVEIPGSVDFILVPKYANLSIA